MGSLTSGHKLHFPALHRTLARQVEEIERLAVEGRAPGAGGQALTPLPPELWARLGESLTRLESLSEAIARRHAPPGAPPADSRQPLAASLRWTALLLRRLEETLEEYDPAAVTRKFGPFPTSGEAERVAEEVAAMHAELAAAQAALEAWRATPPPSPD